MRAARACASPAPLLAALVLLARMGEAEVDAGAGASLLGSWAAGGDLPAYIARPEPSSLTGPDGHPVVIVAHHAVGIYHDTFLREFCDALARLGYVAVLPDLFHRIWSDAVPNGQDVSIDKMNIGAMLASLKDAEVITDLKSTLELLTDPPLMADVKRVAVLGFCMGGRIAWLAGVTQALAPSVRAVVAYHGGNLWKANPPDSGVAPADHLAALSCPVLGHFGGEDANPSPEDMRRLQEGASAAGKPVEFYSYAGAKHGFSCRDSANYLASAAEEAWPRTVAFLAKSLDGPREFRSDL